MDEENNPLLWFDPPLVPGQLLRRYKRFLADVRLADGREVTAHCPNPGSMLSLIDGGPQTVWLTPVDNPARKLKWTLELIEVAGTLVCVNTQRPNALAEAAVARGLVPELAGYDNCRREVRYGENSRIDLLLGGGRRADCYVEVKGVTLSRAPGLVEFPDSVTKRGAKHLRELSRMAADGHRAVMFFLSPRGDGESFRPAADIDSAYADELRTALDAGVEALCRTCHVSARGIYPGKVIPISFD